MKYAEGGVFPYLFSDVRYWADDGKRFRENGNLITYWDNDNNKFPRFLLLDNAKNFLRDISTLEEMLLERGETEVVDVKLFTPTEGLSLFYIKCGGNEYILKLFENTYVDVSTGEFTSAFIPQVELLELHTTLEIVQEIASKGVSRLANNVKITKPAYDIEGEALMADGIIQGNENGLDPLKPLSRIEAATIIVRTLGYENEPTSGNSQFTDIPNDNWGAKYANIAKDKGISQGVGDGKFAPNELVTDNQFATFVLRAAETGEFDWRQAINMLIERGIITTEQAETMDFFTRGDRQKLSMKQGQKD